MPYSNTDIPEDVQDILAYMSPELRHRVEADYETRYAPFLAMLSGWKQSVAQHYASAQDAALERLEEAFFPLGSWNFPGQTVAIPNRPPQKTVEVEFNATLTDVAKRPWMSCGAGWLHPTTLTKATIQRVGADQRMLVLEGEVGEGADLRAMLTRGQLIFAGVREEVVAALARSDWWIQIGVEVMRGACLRYSGYMAFERELQSARMDQRQLDLWLPAYYPYSRRILRVRLTSASEGASPPDLPIFRMPATGFRIVCPIKADGQGVIHSLDRVAAPAQTLAAFRFNPVVVSQNAVDTHRFPAPFPQVGGAYSLRVSGAPNIFAAVALHDDVPVPSSMVQVASNLPGAVFPDVEVQFSQADARLACVKLYHGSQGSAIATGQMAAPTMLDMTPMRLDVILPVIGGVSAGSGKSREDTMRAAWYHSVMRPPLLTESDLQEIISQRQASIGELVRFSRATREIVTEPNRAVESHWRSYLWPTIVARQGAFDAGAIPAANYAPIVQLLTLDFVPSEMASAPDFVLAEAANYLASVLSQYFVIGCFQVEGRLVS